MSRPKADHESAGEKRTAGLLAVLYLLSVLSGVAACNHASSPPGTTESQPVARSDLGAADLGAQDLSAPELARPQSAPPTGTPETRTARSSTEPVGTTRGAKTGGHPDASLPATLRVGQLVETPMERDRNLIVSHASSHDQRALVYLHGMCGNPRGADDWVDLANGYGTFIVVRANVKCPDRPGYKWPKEVALIQERIDAALEKVREERNGLLESTEVTLLGYSQGAHRAERLAEAYPGRYPRLVLGGPPTSPEPGRLRRAQRVAVLGGELENTDHMTAGARALQEAGITTRFFLLPGAHHGAYGPSGRTMMKQVFEFLCEPGSQE